MLDERFHILFRFVVPASDVYVRHDAGSVLKLNGFDEIMFVYAFDHIAYNVFNAFIAVHVDETCDSIGWVDFPSLTSFFISSSL